MTRVMDGVGRGASRTPAPVVVPDRPVRGPGRPRSRPAASGFDGIRRQPAVQATRVVIPPRPTPVPMPAPILPPAPQPKLAPRPSRQFTPPRLPRFPQVTIGRRPLMGAAMTAVALVVSGAVVMSMATPKATTARAEQTVQPSPSPTPTPTPATVRTAAQLQALLNAFAAAHPGKFSIIVKDLNTGVQAEVAADRIMMSASLYKLFVAQRVYQRVDLGQLQLTAAAGSGTGRTVQSCLSVMITVSDNGCGRALGNTLGWGAQDQALHVEGYPGTTLASPQKTTARDVAALFERLHVGTLLSAGSSGQLMNLLKSQRVNNRLPLGVPAGTVLAHKTGDLDGYVHDAGIVYGPKTTYLVVAMSGPWTTPGEAPAKFGGLSRQLWAFFQQ